MNINQIPVGRTKDLTGQKFGKLTALYRVKNPYDKPEAYWHCKCECGNEKDILGKNLQNGHTVSCGCAKRSSTQPGQKYGKWTVLHEAGQQKNRHKKWTCQCECGNIVDVDGAHLRDGSSKSCGKCDRKAVNIPDLVGKQFGKLTVLEQTDLRQNQKVLWKCQCDCGNILLVTTGNLNSGATQSCGCVKSRGERKIIKLLTENNIPFETQKTFTSCKFNDSDHCAYFDFYVNNSYLIEYDGEGHFHYKNQGWNTKENFEKTKERDEFKTQWCEDNNIPLIRIPYTIYGNLTLKDLLLESSDYIVNK